MDEIKVGEVTHQVLAKSVEIKELLKSAGLDVDVRINIIGTDEPNKISREQGLKTADEIELRHRPDDKVSYDHGTFVDWTCLYYRGSCSITIFYAKEGE